MLSLRKKTTLPTSDQSLPGRATPLEVPGCGVTYSP